MKKLIATFLFMIIFAVAAVPAGAQTRGRRNYRNQAAQQQYYDYDQYDNRSVWDKSRDKITTAGGAVGGAILGGLIGGKKGAIIGAIAGGGGAALYTYKIRKSDRPLF
jgi:outer membrane lipoprotein SlyB